jgi:hypothetical protein
LRRNDLRRERNVTSRIRKRDLRTRVAEPVFARVRTYAAAQETTLYRATEQLLLLGLASLDRAPAGTPDTAFSEARVGREEWSPRIPSETNSKLRLPDPAVDDDLRKWRDTRRHQLSVEC